jgi:anhydro-N-acetylmuramic acid kinase
VDAAVTEWTGVGMDARPRLLCLHRQPLPSHLRDTLAQLGANEPRPIRDTTLAHRLLGEHFSHTARQACERAKISLTQVLAIGSPGYTLWHEPEGRFPSTLSLGMTGVIAERTGVTTLSDFRDRDVILGGQGFPLTAVIDYLLFHEPNEDRVLIHLGSMATILWLPREPSTRRLLGFQAGPCNFLLDHLMQRLTGGRELCDAGGKRAVQGCCIEPLLHGWLAHPFLQRRPPKIMPRQEFGHEFIAQTLELARQNQWSLHDLLCTANHFVAQGILKALERFVPRPITRIILSGDGVRNGLLWRLLEQNLERIPVERLDEHGLPCEARKAVAFAGLAALTLDGVAANLPSATGAAGSRLLGSITPGSSANWARCLSWMAAQAVPWNLAAA